MRPARHDWLTLQWPSCGPGARALGGIWRGSTGDRHCTGVETHWPVPCVSACVCVRECVRVYV